MTTNTNKIINLLKKKAFKLNRSLGGKANIKTLKIIQNILPKLKLKNIKSNQKVFDWKVPLVWELKKAYIQDFKGKKIIDVRSNFLHILNYSISVNKVLKKKELFKHLYFSKNKPNSIPYVTSYYKNNWGFCIKYNDLKKFNSDKYKVVIDTSFKNSSLNYGELYIEGKTKKEILFTTYICHPNMGNDNFSGIIINTLIANYVQNLKNYYSYRFLFIPETIGSLYYIKKNLSKLKQNVLAGYVLSCLGTKDNFKIISKYNDNLSRNIIRNFFSENKIKFEEMSWRRRGSDERQFSSPNVNLPFCLISRKKFMDYSQYHSSLDGLSFINNNDLLNTIDCFKKLIKFIEKERFYLSNFKGEPFLSKRNLYSNLSSSFAKIDIQDHIINFFDYCDGKNSFKTIAQKLHLDLKISRKIINILIKNKIIKQI